MASNIAPLIIATILPNAGFMMAEWVGHKLSRNIWLQDLNHPPWVTGNVKIALTAAWAAANLMLGYSSYVAWNSSGRWKGNKLPMTSYALLLLLFWTHYPVYLASRSLKYGLVDIFLAMVTAIATFLLFGQITSLSIPLMSLFMVLLGHECYYSLWLLKHNPPETQSQRPMDHTGEGESTSEPTVPVPKDAAN